jgi:hypothetical protein
LLLGLQDKILSAIGAKPLKNQYLFNISVAYLLQCGTCEQTLSFKIGEKIHLSGEIVS